MDKKVCLTVILLILFSTTAHAGPHRDLCEKVKDADLVFEMHFDVRGVYPKSALDKGYEPPQTEIEKTLKTGKVTKVFKGDIKVGDSWKPSYGTPDLKKGSVKAWKDFFGRKDFSSIYFLKKNGYTYRTTGWAEGSAGCKSSPHNSWCDGYERFKLKVGQCL